jgi:hypothetical protein
MVEQKIVQVAARSRPKTLAISADAHRRRPREIAVEFLKTDIRPPGLANLRRRR